MVEDLIRTHNLALEHHLKRRIPISHPVMAWMVEHVGALLTNYHIHDDGSTGYEKLHGTPCREKIAEFGETVFYFIPKHHRQKLDPRWRLGVFLGRAWGADQNIIGRPAGSITRARAMVRICSSKRWQPARLARIRMTPNNEAETTTDIIEDHEHPHTSSDHHTDDSRIHDSDDGPSGPRRVRSLFRRFSELGFLPHAQNAIFIVPTRWKEPSIQIIPNPVERECSIFLFERAYQRWSKPARRGEDIPNHMSPMITRLLRQPLYWKIFAIYDGILFDRNTQN